MSPLLLAQRHELRVADAFAAQIAPCFRRRTALNTQLRMLGERIEQLNAAILRARAATSSLSVRHELLRTRWRFIL